MRRNADICVALVSNIGASPWAPDPPGLPFSGLDPVRRNNALARVLIEPADSVRADSLGDQSVERRPARRVHHAIAKALRVKIAMQTLPIVQPRMVNVWRSSSMAFKASPRSARCAD